MAKVKLRNVEANTISELPKIGDEAKPFVLLDKDLKEVHSTSYQGKTLVLNIFPSIDTPTCAMSARKFNESAAELDNVKIVNVSYDLPFALGRFCAVEGIDKIDTLSCFRSNFAEEYGTKMIDGPLAGLNARAVIVVDNINKVSYVELVSNISDEPNYQKVLENL